MTTFIAGDHHTTTRLAQAQKSTDYTDSLCNLVDSDLFYHLLDRTLNSSYPGAGRDPNTRQVNVD